MASKLTLMRLKNKTNQYETQPIIEKMVKDRDLDGLWATVEMFKDDRASPAIKGIFQIEGVNAFDRLFLVYRTTNIGGFPNDLWDMVSEERLYQTIAPYIKKEYKIANLLYRLCYYRNIKYLDILVDWALSEDTHVWGNMAACSVLLGSFRRSLDANTMTILVSKTINYLKAYGHESSASQLGGLYQAQNIPRSVIDVLEANRNMIVIPYDEYTASESKYSRHRVKEGYRRVGYGEDYGDSTSYTFVREEKRLGDYFTDERSRVLGWDFQK